MTVSETDAREARKDGGQMMLMRWPVTKKLVRGKTGPAGPILDAKTGRAGPNQVDLNWSGRTTFGHQNQSDLTKTGPDIVCSISLHSMHVSLASYMHIAIPIAGKAMRLYLSGDDFSVATGDYRLSMAIIQWTYNLVLSTLNIKLATYMCMIIITIAIGQ